MNQLDFHLKKEENEYAILQITEVLSHFCSFMDNNVFIDYNYFKSSNENDKYRIFTKYLSNIIDLVLINFPLVTVHINLSTLTMSEIHNHYNFICGISILFKKKYPNKLEKCLVHNAPVVFEKLYSIISLFIDAETQKKIEIV
jgi:hypothetical protein